MGYFAQFVGKTLRSRHANPVVRLGARFCNWYLFHYWNQQNWDVGANGELLFLRALDTCQIGMPKPVVFDVGANTGTYAKLVRRTLANSTIHCFEIVPRTRVTLAENISGMNDVFVSEYGLSNANTALKIGCKRDNDTQSRVLSPLSGTIKEIVECEVCTGDRYLAEHHIETVDLLKIDTEGHELAVLEGFRNALRDARIRTIQFEYGTTWIAPRRLLYEAYTLLEPHGFCIGRLYPDGVFFKPYNRFEDDHFRMGNYVAVHREHAALIDNLTLQ